MRYMIGVDVGGTFTDFSVFDSTTKKLTHYKRSSTPEDPSLAIMEGMYQILEEQDIRPEDVFYFAHGTTSGHKCAHPGSRRENSLGHHQGV